ncbi:MAG: hypothetical protein QXT27_05480 [Pyrobaculum sp.]
MACAPDFCIDIREVDNPPHNPPPGTICIKPEAVSHWLELAQAMYYAHRWRGPARNFAISTMMFLAQAKKIKEALEISAAGGARAICATLTDAPPAPPPQPRGGWDPWKITKFALDLVK